MLPNQTIIYYQKSTGRLRNNLYISPPIDACNIKHSNISDDSSFLLLRYLLHGRPISICPIHQNTLCIPIQWLEAGLLKWYRYKQYFDISMIEIARVCCIARCYTDLKDGMSFHTQLFSRICPCQIIKAHCHRLMVSSMFLCNHPNTIFTIACNCCYSLDRIEDRTNIKCVININH